MRSDELPTMRIELAHKKVKSINLAFRKKLYLPCLNMKRLSLCIDLPSFPTAILFNREMGKCGSSSMAERIHIRICQNIRISIFESNSK